MMIVHDYLFSVKHAVSHLVSEFHFLSPVDNRTSVKLLLVSLSVYLLPRAVCFSNIHAYIFAEAVLAPADTCS